MKVTRNNEDFVIEVSQDDFPMVSLSPNVLGGDPSFSGTRVHVKTLFDYLSDGENLDEFFLDFPSVKKEQVASLLKVLRKIAIVNSYEEEDFS